MNFIKKYSKCCDVPYKVVMDHFKQNQKSLAFINLDAFLKFEHILFILPQDLL